MVFKVAMDPAQTEGDIMHSLFPLPFVPPNNHPTFNAISAVTPTHTRNTKEMPNVWSPTSRASGSTSCLRTELFASHSTLELPVVIKVPPALIPTLVPCVTTSPMDAPNVLPDEVFPIVTRLKADAWEDRKSVV